MGIDERNVRQREEGQINGDRVSADQIFIAISGEAENAAQRGLAVFSTALRFEFAAATVLAAVLAAFGNLISQPGSLLLLPNPVKYFGVAMLATAVLVPLYAQAALLRINLRHDWARDAQRRMLRDAHLRPFGLGVDQMNALDHLNFGMHNTASSAYLMLGLFSSMALWFLGLWSISCWPNRFCGHIAYPMVPALAPTVMLFGYLAVFFRRRLLHYRVLYLGLKPVESMWVAKFRKVFRLPCKDQVYDASSIPDPILSVRVVGILLALVFCWTVFFLTDFVDLIVPPRTGPQGDSTVAGVSPQPSMALQTLSIAEIGGRHYAVLEFGDPSIVLQVPEGHSVVLTSDQDRAKPVDVRLGAAGQGNTSLIIRVGDERVEPEASGRPTGSPSRAGRSGAASLRMEPACSVWSCHPGTLERPRGTRSGLHRTAGSPTKE